MARLFITEREIDFISDLTKEITKDVIGQKIFYFPISATKSQVHQLYAEAPAKVFDNPIVIDCRVKWIEPEIITNQFTMERKFKIEALIQSRDLLDKGIQMYEGDFFSYGQFFFEIAKVTFPNTIYGQVERLGGVRITGLQARKTQFLAKVFGPTWEGFSDPDAVQDTFIQQRGADNREGETGDVHSLVQKGVLDTPLSGPQEVSSRGATTGAGSSFYDE
jgi:hypothetical protein